MLSLTEVSKNQMLVDIQVSCANGLQLKDLATSVDEHVPKVYIYIYIFHYLFGSKQSSLKSCACMPLIWFL